MVSPCLIKTRRGQEEGTGPPGYAQAYVWDASIRGGGGGGTQYVKVYV